VDPHRIVAKTEWIEARRGLLAKEKELTRLRDRLAEERRALPWVKIEKTYVFDGPDGKVTLTELFDGRSQLFIKHFMMGPGAQTQCVGCSFQVDHIEGILVHLNNHDVTYAVVARAPIEEIEAVRKRMGWKFPWVSSYRSDFNYDFDVSFTPDHVASGRAIYNFGSAPEWAAGIEDLSGQSVFFKDDDGNIYLTYASFGARRRRVPHHLPNPRCDAEGARGERPLSQSCRLGAAPQHVRPRRRGRAERPVSLPELWLRCSRARLSTTADMSNGSRDLVCP